MTMRSSSGTRAEMLPLVHATSSLRGSSAWSAHTSRRSAATASVTDRRLLADPAQRVHEIVVAAEVVVQRDVSLVELVVDRGAVLVGLVDVAPDLAYRRRRGLDVVVGAGGDRRVHRRPERRALVGVDQVQRLAQHVGVDLHDHRVLQQAAGDDHLAHLDPGALERLHDLPRPEGGRLDQRAVDVLRARRELEPDHDAAEEVVDEDGPVAAVPVERDEPVLADALLARELGQVAVHVDAALGRLRVVARRNAVLDEPAEDVADAALAGLVAPQPRHDAPLDDAAHARHLGGPLAVDDVAGRGAPHEQELARLGRPGRRRGDVRVDVAGGDRDALRQAGPLGRARGEAADAGAQLDQRRPLHLVLGERGEALVERGEELAIRERAVLVDRLVSGGAEVARLLAAELPDDPVGALDPALHALVELRVLLEDLQRLGELPLARNAAAVPREPRLPPPPPPPRAGGGPRPRRAG